MQRVVLALANLLAVLACLASASAADDDRYRDEIERWRQKRLADLKAEDGWLSVNGLFWLKSGETSIGSDPSNDVLLPARLHGSVGSLTTRRWNGVLSTCLRCIGYPQWQTVRRRHHPARMPMNTRISLAVGRREVNLAQTGRAIRAPHEGQSKRAPHELCRVALVSAQRRLADPGQVRSLSDQIQAGDGHDCGRERGGGQPGVCDV